MPLTDDEIRMRCLEMTFPPSAESGILANPDAWIGLLRATNRMVDYVKTGDLPVRAEDKADTRSRR